MESSAEKGGADQLLDLEARYDFVYEFVGEAFEGLWKLFLLWDLLLLMFWM